MPTSTWQPRAGRALAVLAALAMSLTLVACSGSDTADTPGGSAGVRVVSAADAVTAATESGVVVLDVRTPEEFAAGHLVQARNLPLSDDFRDQVSELPRDGRYLLYCQSGNRSGQAAEIMKDLGFTDVRDGGGIPSLAAAGAEVVTG